ncbi:MAG: UPF0489 family protein [Candidatus Gracilibacteria bacterium]|nr:UPF0489 family protein [Candidatus Gracilibacteria bacterium]
MHKKGRLISIIEGTLDDIRLGDEIVFEDTDETGKLRSCMGLRDFVRIDWNGIPMVIFDNHHYALYFWYEARSRGLLGQGNTLIHIDQHSDLWDNENNITNNGDNLKEMERFVDEQCTVANYIQPAIRHGLIERVVRIEGENDIEKYENYEPNPDESLILNLDLDFFAPDLNYIDFNKKKQTILKFAGQARLITVATSPFFIDQDRAIEYLLKVFEN